MKKTFIALVLGVLFTIPCVLHAEEVENGVYIIRAITEDGAIYQSKILLQR